MNESPELTKMLAMAMVLGAGDLYIDGAHIGKVKSETSTYRKVKPKPKRGQTCPICGKKNVNTYQNSRGTWMCRTCKEECP